MPTRLAPVPFTAVEFNDSFWAPRIEANRSVTLPIEHAMCEQTGRLSVWGWHAGEPFTPHWFWDSDVAKWIEAAAYTLARRRDAAVEAQIDRYVDALTRAQLPDGYANSRYIKLEPDKRWTNLRDAHELYCAGHMIEAAIAYHQATGKRALLDAMARYADHIGAMFGREPGKRRGYCGHEEIELALVKLYRATGERRYLDLAEYFVDERGRGASTLHPGSGQAGEHYYDLEARLRGADPKDYWAKTYEYVQAHKPVREQTEVVGHAVRAMYLYCAMADLAAETGDGSLRAACERLWDHLTQKRMYVTGGIGSAGANEGFTRDYDLPDDSAYCETCAAVGLVFWAHRMFLLTGDGKYIDVLERVLYNGALTGISLDGRTFFYVNPLASDGGWQRQAWWDCACCPPNIARLLASVSGYAYATGTDGLWVNLYASGTAAVRVGDVDVAIAADTCYPWDGAVDLRVSPAHPSHFAVRLRIPEWCAHARILVNGQPWPLDVFQGYAQIEREWRAGDVVSLRLAMSARYTRAHPRARAMAGKIAAQRGPLVYCVEAADNPTAPLDVLRWPASPRALRPEHAHDLLGGVTVLRGVGRAVDEGAWRGGLYLDGEPGAAPADILAVPYYAWANRGAGAMRVWLGVG